VGQTRIAIQLTFDTFRHIKLFRVRELLVSKYRETLCFSFFKKYNSSSSNTFQQNYNVQELRSVPRIAEIEINSIWWEEF